MAERSIYEDIARRTGGDIYIGVVGPVRSGKSTFITRFMQELVLPNMAQDASRERARDEMPQSAAGRTVMTTEPKFVPDEAVALTMEDGVGLRVKMIDCVGYMIPDVMGTKENGSARMVRTPWQEEAMPFAEAAEYGTRRVMCEHATIGMVVTSDGSVGEIPRESYVEAEERIVNEMKALGKPFAVVLNSSDPTATASVALAGELEERYGVPVALVNCLALRASDICGILGMILGEFPVTAVRFLLPAFATALPTSHPIRRALTEDVCRLANGVEHMGDVAEAFAVLRDNDLIEAVDVEELDMGSGRAKMSRTPEARHFNPGVVHQGQFCPQRGQRLETLGASGNATGIQWVKSGGAAEHPTVPHPASPNRESSALDVTGAKFEQPSSASTLAGLVPHR